MRRLNDREWVGHCTAAMSEELQRLTTGAVFLVFTWLNINEIAGVTAVEVSCITYSRCGFL